MTCGMAAGKQKKRLISSTNSEQYKPGKKSKFHPSNFQVILKPHIGLKWDQYLRRVVSEKEQVGILWSDLAPFIESQKHRSGLADVIYVPPETFSFENLRGVLSHEAWSTILTEAERKFLIQFLPSDNDAEENVHLLLTGKNHHFGNPFMNWSTSLCRGDMHPDAVLNKEKQIRNDEKAYSIDLRNYHSSMVETLRKWRKRWLSCGDTDNLFRDNPAKQKQGVVQLKASKSVVALKVAPSVDISKFMSYIEISRTQLNHIKRLKQSGDGIQAKHVSRVIGGLDKIHVKPYGALVEGEQQRLREHWLNMLCDNLPAALKIRKERKMLTEKSRKLLGDELGEKNVSVLRKADQLTDITKELGQHGAYENDGSLIVHDDQLEHSSQSMSQDRNDHRTPLQDQDDQDTKYMETSLCHNASPTVKDHDLIVVNGTDIISESEQKNSDMHAQINKDICCADEGIPCCVINRSEENVVLMHKDGLNVQDEDIKEISYKDTTLNNLLSSESQQLKSTNCTSTSIHTFDRENMQVQDLDGVAYAGPSIHAHEQDHSLKSISHAIINHNGHGVSFSAENSHPKMNAVTGDQEESDNTVVIPSNSSSLLSKPSVGQTPAEDFLNPDDQLAKSEKGSWQLAGPVQSYYHPPENRMYNNDSGDLQIKQRYLSSAQQSSSIYVDNNVFNRQQAQVATTAFPVDNSASFIEPISNCLSNGQLQIAMDIGTSNSLQHADSIEQSIGLQSFSNNRSDQSVPILKPLQEQPLIDQSQDGLYVQLHNNLYSDARFQAKGNHPVAEQQSCHVFPSMDSRYNLFPEGNHSHNNNLSVMESGNYLTQALPTGSNSDGSLFSALSQFKQPSVHMQPVRSSPSQLLETRNQVYPAQTFVTRTQDTNPLLSNIYGYTRNAPSGPSSHAESAGSLNNMHWTNFIQQNPGMPDLTNRQFRGPWTR